MHFKVLQIPLINCFRIHLPVPFFLVVLHHLLYHHIPFFTNLQNLIVTTCKKDFCHKFFFLITTTATSLPPIQQPNSAKQDDFFLLMLLISYTCNQSQLTSSLLAMLGFLYIQLASQVVRSYDYFTSGFITIRPNYLTSYLLAAKQVAWLLFQPFNS